MRVENKDHIEGRALARRRYVVAIKTLKRKRGATVEQIAKATGLKTDKQVRALLDKLRYDRELPVRNIGPARFALAA